MDTLDNAAISHFIPSVQLTGSREEKLRKLDGLIRHLHQLRDVLAEGASASSSDPGIDVPARRHWRWFAAGSVSGVVLALLVQLATRWLL